MSSNNLICLNNPLKPKKRILFIGYNQSQTKIINELIKYKCYIDYTDELSDINNQYDFVVSFGYKYNQLHDTFFISQLMYYS
jgi:hypothetical protein